MKVEILAVTPDAQNLIERSGRTCYQSKDGIKEGSSADFIKRLVKSGHLSVLEHAYATIRLTGVTRALTHQLVRHRLCAFSQQSQRYVKESGFSFTVPPKIESDKAAKKLFKDCISKISRAYAELLELNIKKEDARYVLPNACHTEIVFSCDFRELRHMFVLRGAVAAQWEIRECFIELQKKMKAVAPECFFDLTVNEDKRTIEKII